MITQNEVVFKLSSFHSRTSGVSCINGVEVWDDTGLADAVIGTPQFGWLQTTMVFVALQIGVCLGPAWVYRGPRANCAGRRGP